MFAHFCWYDSYPDVFASLQSFFFKILLKMWKQSKNNVESYKRLNDKVKFVLLCFKTALICRDPPEGVCGSSRWWPRWVTAPSSFPRTPRWLWMGWVWQPDKTLCWLSVRHVGALMVGTWGGQHCQEGLRLRCHNIFIGAICAAKIIHIRMEDISNSVSGLWPRPWTESFTCCLLTHKYGDHVESPDVMVSVERCSPLLIQHAKKSPGETNWCCRVYL